MRRPGRAALAAALAALGACARATSTAIPVRCSEILPIAAAAADSSASALPARGAGAPDSTATAGLAPALGVEPDQVLDLIVVLDSVPPGPGSVLVRVDRLDERGLVEFFMPPPTAAAAGMTLEPPPTFQGCAVIAAAGLELRAPFAPRAKAWVRASTDRAVRVRLRVGRRTTEEPLLIDPGTSGIIHWEAT